MPQSVLRISALRISVLRISVSLFGKAPDKTVCPSGLRGWTQVPLARAAWVQIPQLIAAVVGPIYKVL